MFHSSFFKRYIALAVLGLLFAGCGTSSSNAPAAVAVAPSVPTTAPPTSTTVASTPTVVALPASGAVLGVYANGKALNGPETLTLLDSGRFILQVEGDYYPITGTLAIVAEQMVFTEAVGEGDCPNIPGTYKFVMDGKALTFTKVQDACDFRVEDFMSGPWIKKQ